MPIEFLRNPNEANATQETIELFAESHLIHRVG